MYEKYESEKFADKSRALAFLEKGGGKKGKVKLWWIIIDLRSTVNLFCNPIRVNSIDRKSVVFTLRA